MQEHESLLTILSHGPAALVEDPASYVPESFTCGPVEWGKYLRNH